MQYRMKMALYAVVLLAALMLDEAVFGALKLRYKPLRYAHGGGLHPACGEGVGRAASLALWAAACGHGQCALPAGGVAHYVFGSGWALAIRIAGQRFFAAKLGTIFSVNIPALLLTEGVYVLADVLPRGLFRRLSGSRIWCRSACSLPLFLQCFTPLRNIFPEWRIPWIEPIAFAAALSYS